MGSCTSAILGTGCLCIAVDLFENPTPLPDHKNARVFFTNDSLNSPAYLNAAILEHFAEKDEKQEFSMWLIKHPAVL